MIKPALFNTDMVRAILEGRKTVTRRAVKQQPSSSYELVRGMYRDGNGRLCAVFHSSEDIKSVYPNYDRGDILWVRETWSISDGAYLYRAFPGVGMEPDKQDAAMREMGLKWRPSIFMPREAARIFLRVTDVRVERLQEITAEGALDEGTDVMFPEPKPSYISLAYTEMRLKPAARQSFSKLWDSTIKPKDLSAYGWEANPWVWVIEFERISKEDAFCE